MRSFPVALLLIGLSAACADRSPDLARISGKTTWGEMAVEEVELRVFPAHDRKAPPLATGRSGYHGSFAFRLPVGSYHIKARGTLPAPGSGRRVLEGEISVTLRPSAASAMHRVRLPLREVED